MTTLIRTPRADRSRAASPALALTLRIARTRDRFPAALAGIAALFALCFAIDAQAQQVTNPGDIIVERTVTPRDAFVPVPRDQDPVAVRATTFPADSVNPAI